MFVIAIVLNCSHVSAGMDGGVAEHGGGKGAVPCGKRDRGHGECLSPLLRRPACTEQTEKMLLMTSEGRT